MPPSLPVPVGGQCLLSASQTVVQRSPSGRCGLADGGPARSVGSLRAGRRRSSAVRRVAAGWQTVVQRGPSGRCGLAGGGPARFVGSLRAGRRRSSWQGLPEFLPRCQTGTTRRTVGSFRSGRRQSSAVRRVAPGWQTAGQRCPSGRPGLADGGPARSVGSPRAGRRRSSAVRRVAPGWPPLSRGRSGRRRRSAALCLAAAILVYRA